VAIKTRTSRICERWRTAPFKHLRSTTFNPIHAKSSYRSSSGWAVGGTQFACGMRFDFGVKNTPFSNKRMLM
jgi:hypothetical protein